eukprot:CAMPEP_0205923438 /NCGR_PEP_ID=MMETSP1325-20131115/16210_1 /ASSEMBLY_ACC=CAM_ASM_000708 /TAXON_ID=236786 /ORGANISM="Florenciella sp., Strain RCC1007" /LENGTH=54 /DNA_ID=CAMNT_0053291657 /DNA_START=282 /DNA_END=443 /DNA_ORIENTATION=-
MSGWNPLKKVNAICANSVAHDATRHQPVNVVPLCWDTCRPTISAHYTDVCVRVL